MKTLNALVLCPVMACASAPGIRNALAAGQGKRSATQKGAVDDVHERQDSGMDDIASAPTAGDRDKGGMSDMSWNENREPGRTKQPVACGDAEEAMQMA